ncbi:MAG: TonB-dependent receptor [Bryobacterales bacterium]|nr:TonB-dependent receptor [Bryobacterales bacterium]
MFSRRLIWVRGLLAALCAQCLFAQSSDARLSGRVVDPAGAAVAGAEVRLVNPETGVALRTRSNEAGVYAFPYVLPGPYRLEAESGGFRKYERTGLQLGAAEVRELDVRLELGAVTETTTVSAEAPLVETGNATVGQYVSNEMLVEMPLTDRNSLDLVGLAGGVVPLEQNANQKAQFSLAGGRVLNQAFSLDGGNIQNVRIGIGQNEYDPPVEVLQEFRVVQNAYSAEFGGSAGGAVISTTKSGTNRLHGSAWEYFRNEKLDAAGFFAPIDPATGARSNPKLRYNQFGATVGGPVRRNRTHFFACYQALRRVQGQTQILTVPTLEQRAGDFSELRNINNVRVLIYDPATTRASGAANVRDPFPDNRVPSNRIDAISAKFLDAWPAPNRPGANVAGGENVVGIRTWRAPTDDFLGRLDHVFSAGNRLYARFVQAARPQNWSTIYPRPEADPENNHRIDRPESSILVSDAHTFTPSLILEARYAYSTRTNHVQSAGVGSNVAQTLGLKGVDGSAYPALTIPGYARVGQSREVFNKPVRQNQTTAAFTYSRGTHLFKFGGEFRRVDMVMNSRPQISGAWNFAATATNQPGLGATGNTFASFLLGLGDSFSVSDIDPLRRDSTYLAAFVQDDWKIAKNLLLNLGVRWETDTPLNDADNRMNGFDLNAINPVSGTPGVVKFAGVNGWPEAPYNANQRNFGPRVGFAWRPFGSERWVVRGGFGVFFEHPFDGDVTTAASAGFQKSADLVSPDTGITPAFVFRNGVTVNLRSERNDSFGAVPLGRAATTSITFFERNRVTGYAQQFNLSVQRQFGATTVVELTYMANLSRHMPNTALTLNQVPPDRLGVGNAQSRRPFPQFSGVSLILPTNGVSNYHAGMARVEKRLSHGLSILASYTWSRNIGNLSEVSGYGDNQNLQDFYNRRLDKGPSTIDIPQRLVASSVYRLPFGRQGRWLTSGAAAKLAGGWMLASVFSLQSGGPFTVAMQNNTTNAFSAGALRGNLVGEPNLPGSERTIGRWFNTAAFQAPAAYTFGNAGRGILRGDGRLGWNASFSRNFFIAERVRLQFRGDLFSLLNHPNFGLPGHSMGAANFGVVAASSGARVVQLGFRLSY